MKKTLLFFLAITLILCITGCASLNNAMTSKARNNMIQAIEDTHKLSEEDLNRVKEILDTPGVSCTYDDFEDRYAAYMFDTPSLLGSIETTMKVFFSPTNKDIKSYGIFEVNYLGKSWAFLDSVTIRCDGEDFVMDGSTYASRQVVIYGHVTEDARSLIGPEFKDFARAHFLNGTDIKIRAYGQKGYVNGEITNKGAKNYVLFLELLDILEKLN